MKNLLRPCLRTATLALAALGLAELGQAQCTLQTIPTGPSGPSSYNDLVAVSGPFLALRRGFADEVDVYEEVAGSWQLSAHLTGFDFVGSIALDGKRLVIGTPDPSGSLDAVHAYRMVGASWIETEVLQPSDPANSAFGDAVALAGTTLLVGDPLANGSGEVVRYEDVSLGFWVAVDTLQAAQPVENGQFGVELALESGTLLIGETGPVPGRVHVFELQGGAYVPQQVVPGPNDPSGTGFGFGSALSLAGDLAAVGSPLADQSLLVGRAWVLERSAGSWTITATLSQPNPLAFDQFGVDVSVEEDVIAIASSNEGPTGAAHVFERDAGGWSLSTTIPGNAAFGLNSVLLHDTRLILSGAPVRVVDPLGASTFCVAKVNSDGCVPAIASSGQASLSSPSPAIVSAANVLSQRTGLFFYGAGPLGIPFQGGSLCAQPPLKRTTLMSSGGNAPVDCSGSYAFDLNAWVQGANDPNLFAGSRIIGQFWSRDPAHPDGTGTGLTNAIDLLLCP